MGSNINPEENVKLAEKHVSECTHLIKISQFYLTKPEEFLNQSDFLNGAFLVATWWDHEILKSELKRIEAKQGRHKTPNKAGPRCIDLDILVWNDVIIDEHLYQWSFLRKIVLELMPTLEFKNK